MAACDRGFCFDRGGVADLGGGRQRLPPSHAGRGRDTRPARASSKRRWSKTWPQLQDPGVDLFELRLERTFRLGTQHPRSPCFQVSEWRETAVVFSGDDPDLVESRRDRDLAMAGTDCLETGNGPFTYGNLDDSGYDILSLTQLTSIRVLPAYRA